MYDRIVTFVDSIMRLLCVLCLLCISCQSLMRVLSAYFVSFIYSISINSLTVYLFNSFITNQLQCASYTDFFTLKVWSLCRYRFRQLSWELRRQDHSTHFMIFITRLLILTLNHLMAVLLRSALSTGDIIYHCFVLFGHTFTSNPSTVWYWIFCVWDISVFLGFP